MRITRPFVLGKGIGLAACILLAAPESHARNGPTTLAELESYHRDTRSTMRPFTAKAQRFREFTVDGNACTSLHAMELRYKAGVLNARGQRIGYTGFKPTYRLSDGITHSGDNPNQSDLQVRIGDRVFYLSVHASDSNVVQYAQLADPETFIDILSDGRFLPANIERASKLEHLSNGNLVAVTSTTNREQVTIEVDPRRDFLIVHMLTGSPKKPLRKTSIVEAQKCEGRWFPRVVLREEYRSDGKHHSSTRIVYRAPKIGEPVELWMTRLPAGIGVVGPDGMFQTDSNGDLVAVAKEPVEGVRVDVARIVQFLALIGTIGFGVVLGVRWWKSRA